MQVPLDEALLLEAEDELLFELPDEEDDAEVVVTLVVVDPPPPPPPHAAVKLDPKATVPNMARVRRRESDWMRS